MKIAVIQPDIVWGNPEANAVRMEELVASAGPADLYVLPEMWSTGFTMSPETHAEKAPYASLEWMKKTAARTGAAVAGSIAVDDNGFKNRFFFVKPDGQTVSYDKKHLFTYSGEDKHYDAGDERVVVEWKGIRFRLVVCYDLRFPVWCRNRCDYDALLCVASWPDKRSFVWKNLLVARAIENQAYVIGVNRVGSDPTCTYSGDSVIIDAYGAAVAGCEPGKPGFCTAETDMEELARFREKFPVLRDADKI